MTNESWIKQPELIDHLKSQFTLDWHGIHGIRHWARVLWTGKHIADREGARLDVVCLFALLHDHKRLNDEHDPHHGHRAVVSAMNLRGEFFQIDDEGFKLLCVAMADHSDGHTEGDITIQTCWDADRLDLGRVGTLPQARYLCTQTARDPILINTCYRRSIGLGRMA